MSKEMAPRNIDNVLDLVFVGLLKASIKVTWPESHMSVQTLNNVGVNKIFACTESSGCVEK